MRRYITALLLTLSAVFCIHAQERLTISVAAPEGISNENAAATLTSNLKQALVLNDAASDSSRFVLQARIAELSKDVTSTAPPMFVTELEISLFITDTSSGDVLSQTSFTIKGIADSDQASYMDAVKKVKARDPKLRALLKPVFTRKRAPKYFFFGMAFLLFSFLVPYKLYYILFGTALTLFSLGISYFLSTLYVFFRDIKHIYSVILTLWTYLTPLFYTVSALKNPAVSKFMVFNPMFHYVETFRDMLAGRIPTGVEYLFCYGFAFLSLAIGWLFLRAVKNKIAAQL